MASRTDFTDAFVLRVVDYGEADRIVTLLTSRFGKIAALARGARRSQKRFGASLEPFTKIEAEIAMGRGELARFAQARIVRVFPTILTDLQKMTHAGRALEWTRLGLPPRLPEPHAMQLVEEFFAGLDAAPSGDGSLLAAFLVRLADILGFSPRFDACGLCGRVAPSGKPGTFDAQLGALVCRSCGGAAITLSAQTREKLAETLREDWTAFARDWPLGVVDQAMHALDALLRAHVAEASETKTRTRRG